MFACIIVNDNNLSHTLDMYARLRKFHIFDSYILVNNHTSKEDYQYLLQYEGPVTDVIIADRCGGPGYLANIGLRYARARGNTFALLLEEDVSFEEASVKRGLAFMQDHPDALFAGPKWSNQESGYRFGSPYAFVAHCMAGTARRSKALAYAKGRFDPCHQCTRVDVVQSGCTIISLDQMARLGWFDENPQLLHKEFAAASKARLRGMKSYILTDCPCTLLENRNPDPASCNERIEMTLASMQYYLKTYLHFDKAGRILKMAQPFFYLIWGADARRESRSRLEQIKSRTRNHSVLSSKQRLSSSRVSQMDF